MRPLNTRSMAIAVVASMLVLDRTDAHSHMSLPAAEFTNPSNINNPTATIDGPSALTPPPDMFFDRDGMGNTAAYTEAIKNSEYKSLQDLIMAKATPEAGATLECGIAKMDAPAQDLPEFVEYAASDSEGFTETHYGPCEVWCDDERVFENENCSLNFKGSPAKLPYDKAKCAGKKLLTSHWLALHVSTWQVYTACVPINGGDAPAPAAEPAPAPTPAPAPAPTPTVKPTPGNAPTPDTEEEDCDDLEVKEEDDCDDLEVMEESPTKASSSTPAAAGAIDIATLLSMLAEPGTVRANPAE